MGGNWAGMEGLLQEGEVDTGNLLIKDRRTKYISDFELRTDAEVCRWESEERKKR